MKHTHSFRPRARLLQLLGDQLIADARIAVFELVKNAFDADSPDVQVIIKDIEDPDSTSIVIADTGDGMNLATVRDIWLEPGADHREKQRLAGKRSKKHNRLPLGEKGVGRFAAHKLGDKIELVTRRIRNDEIIVSIDWGSLINGNRYLEDAVVTVETREPQVFKGKKHGTRLTVSSLHKKWTRGDIRRLYRSINAISRPFGGNDGFDVKFEMQPDPGWTKGLLSAAEIEAQALFVYEFSIDGGRFDFTYEFRPLPALIAKAKNRSLKDFGAREIQRENQLLEFFVMETGEDGKKKKRPVKADLNKVGIGKIHGRLVGYDRDREMMELYVDSKSLTDFLDNNGGIRVYRDGIRVYNYGEPGTDWLGLDERRIQVPSRRIGNNLVLGEINLDLAMSSQLVEKTNREGFVENDAYHELRNAVLSALIMFEQERDIDKSKIRDLLKKQSSTEPFPQVRGPDEAIDVLRQRVKARGWAKELTPFIDKVEETYSEVRDTLLQAVGSGLGLSIVFHEIERGVRDLEKAMNGNNSKQKIMMMARHLVELLDGASYFVRTASDKSFKASDLVDHAIFSLSSRFAYHSVAIVNSFKKSSSDFVLNGSRQMITASVVNLIDNALYWLNLAEASQNGKAKQKRIWIGSGTTSGERTITVADNGPGFVDSPEAVVKPFFTRKPDGMGIGLYFVNMTMQAHAGRLEFPDRDQVEIPAAYTGAVISMNFGGASK